MSDASTSSSESPTAKLMNSILMLGVPAFLMVMLGVMGIFFVAGMGDTDAEKDAAKEKIAAANAVASTTPGAPASPAPAGGAAPGPAAPSPAGGGLPEGVTEDFWNLGKSTYATCAACHGPDGKGLQLGPSLMAPSMVGSEMLLGNPDQSTLVVLKGIQKESMDFVGVMTPLGAGLSDEQIAAVLTYCRNSWGNSAPAVTTEQVAADRAKFADVDAPAGIKRADIEAIAAGGK